MHVISVLHYKCAAATNNALRQLKAQIAAQPNAPEWRLVCFVARDGGTEEIDAPSGVSVIQIANNGFTANWNAALAHISDIYPDWQFAGLFNNDIIIQPGFIDNLLSPFENKSVGIVSPTFNSPHRFIYVEDGSVFLAPYVEFTAPVIRRECFEKTGKLNEVFRLGWGVDFEYCFRARQAGFKIMVNGASKFTHLEHKSIKEFSKYAQKAANEMKAGLYKSMGGNWRALLLNGFDKTKYPMPI